MKFFIGILLVAAGVGGFMYYRVASNPSRRACSRMAELCGDKETDAKQCETDFAELRKIGGDESLEKPAKCMVEAKNCGEAMGCYAGAVGNSGMKFFKDALKGLTKSLGDKVGDSK